MKSQPTTDHKDWKTLYHAAIVETDETTIHSKIAIAENALLQRGWEIFYQDGCLEEKDTLETTLQAIPAFRATRRNRQARAYRKGNDRATVASRVLLNWYARHAELHFPTIAES